MSQKIRVKSITKTFPKDREDSLSFPLSNTKEEKKIKQMWLKKKRGRSVLDQKKRGEGCIRFLYYCFNISVALKLYQNKKLKMESCENLIKLQKYLTIH